MQLCHYAVRYQYNDFSSVSRYVTATSLKAPRPAFQSFSPPPVPTVRFAFGVKFDDSRSVRSLIINESVTLRKLFWEEDGLWGRWCAEVQEGIPVTANGLFCFGALIKNAKTICVRPDGRSGKQPLKPSITDCFCNMDE
ncbi:uncharacterized protein CLUP02_09898 [Colletotrichum lupini]|uniref:Uncharacterized protein n=1 Tax=Colletotrichum lupini TaxID=145971 RepID=A0A9Q8SX89_9PEZI|nr:uncharacterized protein CLUP02_09898 [Colletotrichum lupini]UQC84401.1 hypothetical protein CLUP02_09898 [Colletotrichum lupini]